jgi:hypothetical protein
MDIAVLAPIALVIMRWARFWNTSELTLWLLLLILLPFNLVRLLSALGLPQKRQWRILFVALVLVLLVSWRGLLYAPRPILDFRWVGEFIGHLGDLRNPQWARDLAVFLFVMVAWWRGLRLAQMTPNIHQIGFRLRAAVLILAPLALILYATGRLWAATPYVLLYFLAGLTAVALIRAEQIERERSGFAASLTPRWVVTIFLTSLLVVMTAGLIAAIISGDAITLLSGRLAPIWTAFLATFAISLSTVIFLLTPVISVIIWLLTRIADVISRIFGSSTFELGANGLGDLSNLQFFDGLVRGEGFNFTVPPTLSRTLVIGLMLGVAAVITFFLTRLFRQPPAATRSKTASHRPGMMAEPSSGLGERILERLGLMRRWRTAASIRRIYSDMCHVAAEAGYARGMAQTPYEYLTTLSEAWPNNQPESRLITEAYIRVRYGEIPETEAELQTIKNAWQQLSDLNNEDGPVVTLQD